MSAKKKAEGFDLDRWVHNAQMKKCKICRNREASKLIDDIIEAAERQDVQVPFLQMRELLEERGLISTTSYTVRDHVRRCNVKKKLQAEE